ncbi:MAG: AAA family ATPase, partial [Candidatus Competibacteraceae bacterium]|nr:AAA family ATPase [Candidatus Competibacteraceae bacterium]
STAEAINVAYSAAAENWYLGSGELQPRQLLRHLRGTVIKDDEDDRKRVKNYLRLVRSKRVKEPEWDDLLQGEQWL